MTPQEIEKIKLKCNLICSKSELVAITYSDSFIQYTSVEEKKRLMSAILDVEKTLEELSEAGE